ncbi:MAG TPA: hypothetical protein VMR41_05600 [Patescibacteria group bacterium]|nr:hypothetical protein [Patescibacteria group bacterium]
MKKIKKNKDVNFFLKRRTFSLAHLAIAIILYTALAGIGFFIGMQQQQITDLTNVQNSLPLK